MQCRSRASNLLQLTAMKVTAGNKKHAIKLVTIDSLWRRQKPISVSWKIQLFAPAFGTLWWSDRQRGAEYQTWESLRSANPTIKTTWSRLKSTISNQNDSYHIISYHIISYHIISNLQWCVTKNKNIVAVQMSKYVIRKRKIQSTKSRDEKVSLELAFETVYRWCST